jgi:hypothetical protein
VDGGQRQPERVTAQREGTCRKRGGEFPTGRRGANAMKTIALIMLISTILMLSAWNNSAASDQSEKAA